MSVFFDTESVTFAPSISARAFASGLDIVSSVPVNTTILPAIGLSAASPRAASSIGQFGGEFVQRVDIAFFAEEISEFLCDRGADTVDAAQFQPLIRSGGSGGQHLPPPVFKIAVMPGQKFRVGRTDAANAESVDEPLQRHASAAPRSLGTGCEPKLAPAFAGSDLGFPVRQSEQIGGAVQPAFVVELLDGFFAQPVDIERRA